jgi:hypothetical protein
MKQSKLPIRSFAGGLLLCAATAGLGPGAAQAQQTPTSYRVHVRLETDYSSGPFSGHATATADITAKGGPDAYTGSAAVRWDDLQYRSDEPACTITPTTKTGTIRVAVERQPDGQLKVTWDGDPVSSIHLHCEDPDLGSVDSDGPVIEPVRNTEPKTFTVPASGGTQNVSGSYSINARRDVTTGTVTVSGSPCDNPANQVADVSTRTGDPSSLGDLKGTTLQPGQRLTADQDVQLDFGDGSTLRLTKGSSYQVSECGSPAKPGQSFKVRLSLFVGSIWAKIAKQPNRAMEFDTGRVVVGNRGTVLSVSSERGTTTVHVYEGSVWMQREQGARLTGRQFIVKAGQTATWSGRGTPQIRRQGGTSTAPTSDF